MQQLCKTAVILLVIFAILTGMIYPLIVTTSAQLFFNHRANGSLLYKHHQIMGSEWIGQAFDDPIYFWGRPSATTPFPYNAENSMGSNLSPTNPDLMSQIQNRMMRLQKGDPDHHQLIPIDLVTSSASGLDPEISPRAAIFQINRIIKARHLPLQEAEHIKQFIQHLTKKRQFGILGENRINVLQLNLMLDDHYHG